MFRISARKVCTSKCGSRCLRYYSKPAPAVEYNIDLKNLADRWEKMPTDDQQDVVNYLDVKQKFAWPHLTEDERKAAYYISYGKWGPRNRPLMTVPEMIFKGMTSLLLFAVVGFAFVNYKKDQKKIAEMEKKEPSDTAEAK